MKNILENNKLTFFIGGIMAATLGVKALKSKYAHEFFVSTLASGMKLQDDAKVMYENIKEDAVDLCYEAKLESKKTEPAGE